MVARGEPEKALAECVSALKDSFQRIVSDQVKSHECQLKRRMVMERNEELFEYNTNETGEFYEYVDHVRSPQAKHCMA